MEENFSKERLVQLKKLRKELETKLLSIKAEIKAIDTETLLLSGIVIDDDLEISKGNNLYKTPTFLKSYRYRE